MTHSDLKMNVNENILQINRMVASRRLMMSWIKPISLAYPFTHIPFGMISNFDFLPKFRAQMYCCQNKQDEKYLSVF